MLKDIIEEKQQAIKNLLYKAQEKNWKNGGVSIYELSDLQEASDKVVAETAQIVAREVLRKVREGVPLIVNPDNKDAGYTSGQQAEIREFNKGVESVLTHLQSLENELLDKE